MSRIPFGGATAYGGPWEVDLADGVEIAVRDLDIGARTAKLFCQVSQSSGACVPVLLVPRSSTSIGIDRIHGLRPGVDLDQDALRWILRDWRRATRRKFLVRIGRDADVEAMELLVRMFVRLACSRVMPISEILKGMLELGWLMDRIDELVVAKGQMGNRNDDDLQAYLTALPGAATNLGKNQRREALVEHEAMVVVLRSQVPDFVDGNSSAKDDDQSVRTAIETGSPITIGYDKAVSLVELRMTLAKLAGGSRRRLFFVACMPHVDRVEYEAGGHPDGCRGMIVTYDQPVLSRYAVRSKHVVFMGVEPDPRYPTVSEDDRVAQERFLPSGAPVGPYENAEAFMKRIDFLNSASKYIKGHRWKDGIQLPSEGYETITNIAKEVERLESKLARIMDYVVGRSGRDYTKLVHHRHDDDTMPVEIPDFVARAMG